MEVTSAGGTGLARMRHDSSGLLPLLSALLWQEAAVSRGGSSCCLSPPGPPKSVTESRLPTVGPNNCVEAGLKRITGVTWAPAPARTETNYNVLMARDAGAFSMHSSTPLDSFHQCKHVCWSYVKHLMLLRFMLRKISLNNRREPYQRNKNISEVRGVHFCIEIFYLKMLLKENLSL